MYESVYLDWQNGKSSRFAAKIIKLKTVDWCGKCPSFKAVIIKLKTAVEMLGEESPIPSGASSKKKKTGRRRKDETSAETKIIGALKIMLRERGKDNPPQGKEIAEMAGVSPNSVKNFLKHSASFGSQTEFAAAWRRDNVKPKLACMEYSSV
jgi:hypothetical protein